MNEEKDGDGNVGPATEIAEEEEKNPVPVVKFTWMCGAHQYGTCYKTTQILTKKHNYVDSTYIHNNVLDQGVRGPVSYMFNLYILMA